MPGTCGLWRTGTSSCWSNWKLAGWAAKARLLPAPLLFLPQPCLGLWAIMATAAPLQGHGPLAPLGPSCLAWLCTAAKSTIRLLLSLAALNWSRCVFNLLALCQFQPTLTESNGVRDTSV